MIGEQFVVDIDKHECSCRKWTITAIPCCHALTAIRFLNLNAEDFLPHWFLASTYEETYLSLIYPVNGPHLWEITAANDVLPPTKRVLPGRPKKKRRLEAWELRKDDTQLRQGGTLKKCGLCRQIGHKRTSCPHAPPAPAETGPSGTQQNTPADPTQPSQSTPQTDHTQPSQPIPPTQCTQPSQTTEVSQPQNHTLPTQASQTLPTQASQTTAVHQMQSTTIAAYREKLSFRRGPI